MPEVILAIVLVGMGWLLVTALVPVIARICHERDWLDQPGPRKIHPRPTPRLTGAALFVAIWLPVLVLAVLRPDWLAEFSVHAIPIAVGAVVILALGTVDDLRPLSGITKLLLQIGVGSYLFFSGVNFDRLWIPFVGGFELGILAWPVTVIWFLILVNAINIIDGLDGLATATAGVATLTLVWVSYTLNLHLIWVGAAGLLGGLIAFYRYNKPPARVFMGDTGSLSLGYFFAIVALLAPIKRFTVVAFFVPVFAVFLPLAEAALSVGRRSLKGANPLGADRGHLHHLLLRAGWTQKRIIGVYAAITAVFGVFSVLLRYGNRRLIAFLMGIFVLFIILRLGIILRTRGRGTSARHGAS